MNTKLIVLLRVVLGWFFFYAGYSKFALGTWSAAGFLMGAKTFPGLYAWFAGPGNIGLVNALNVYGQMAIGIALILGVGVRVASYAGALMMLLYYFPSLEFPKAGAHGYIVDDHIIYIAAFLVLAAVRAGRTLGLEATAERLVANGKSWYRAYIG